jgi:hypothetical protein
LLHIDLSFEARVPELPFILFIKVHEVLDQDVSFLTALFLMFGERTIHTSIIFEAFEGTSSWLFLRIELAFESWDHFGKEILAVIYKFVYEIESLIHPLFH